MNKIHNYEYTIEFRLTQVIVIILNLWRKKICITQSNFLTHRTTD